jgi:hypothetical protein
MNRILQIVLLASLSIVLFSSGCKNVITTQPKEIWTTDLAGNINTNNLERIQNITPFTIVIPKYLPEELKQYPVWVIKEKNTDAPEITTIRLQYDNRSSTNIKALDISEINSPKTGSSFHVDQNEIYYSGVKIDEIHNIDSQQNVEYTYDWYSRNIRFLCSITGYEQTEARKIATSMIEEIN